MARCPPSNCFVVSTGFPRILEQGRWPVGTGFPEGPGWWARRWYSASARLGGQRRVFARFRFGVFPSWDDCLLMETAEMRLPRPAGKSSQERRCGFRSDKTEGLCFESIQAHSLYLRHEGTRTLPIVDNSQKWDSWRGEISRSCSERWRVVLTAKTGPASRKNYEKWKCC